MCTFSKSRKCKWHKSRAHKQSSDSCGVDHNGSAREFSAESKLDHGRTRRFTIVKRKWELVTNRQNSRLGDFKSEERFRQFRPRFLRIFGHFWDGIIHFFSNFAELVLFTGWPIGLFRHIPTGGIFVTISGWTTGWVGADGRGYQLGEPTDSGMWT